MVSNSARGQGGNEKGAIVPPFCPKWGFLAILGRALTAGPKKGHFRAFQYLGWRPYRLVG